MEQDLTALRIDRSARKRRGLGRKLLAGLAVCLIVCVAVVLWKLGSRRRPVVEVAVARAVDSGSVAVLNASGYVTPRRRATVSSKITGKVVEVLVDEGMVVDSGQVLARLDAVDALAALHAVEAEHSVALASLAELEVELANAKRTLKRSMKLRRSDLISEEDLDSAETSVAGLEAQLALARERIEASARNVAVARRGVENCTIHAPFSGVVVSKDAQPGEMVSPVSAGGGFTRTGIATIVDMESLEIEVDVNESYIARVSPGQRVDAVIDAYPEWRIPAGVRTVIPTADRQKATVRVRIVFDELDPRILPDMGVKVAFLEGDTDSHGNPRVVVPRDAVRDENGTAVVYVLKGKTVERRAIRTGSKTGGEIEVLAGVHGGERVVVGKDQPLRDGQRVAVRR